MDTLLRYPGGKARSIKQIAPYIPVEGYSEYREPFMGGGAVFFHIRKNILSFKTFWINDIRPDLIHFWTQVRDNPISLKELIFDFKNEFKNGRELYSFLKEFQENNSLEIAAKFFIMNRITYSGVMDAGSFSEAAYRGRFTDNSINRIQSTSLLLKDVKITCGDYSHLLNDEDKNAFIYLDPPYYGNSKSKLYGKKGYLHTEFDHQRLSDNLGKAKSRWLLSYDDHEDVRKMYEKNTIHTDKFQYGIQSKSKNELIISSKTKEQL